MSPYKFVKRKDVYPKKIKGTKGIVFFKFLPRKSNSNTTEYSAEYINEVVIIKIPFQKLVAIQHNAKTILSP